MEFQKKPVVIEAFRFYIDDMPDWFMDKVATNDIILRNCDYRKYYINEAHCEIKTLEGVMTGRGGDYIIKGVQGEVYPCKPDIFLETYDAVGERIMNFGQAIEALKRGNKVARSGWNGRGMFVVYQKGYPQGIPCNKQTAEAWGMQEGDLFICNPYLQIKNVNGSHSMWVPSINDVLAEDWNIVE